VSRKKKSSLKRIVDFQTRGGENVHEPAGGKEKEGKSALKDPRIREIPPKTIRKPVASKGAEKKRGRGTGSPSPPEKKITGIHTPMLDRGEPSYFVKRPGHSRSGSVKGGRRERTLKLAGKQRIKLNEMQSQHLTGKAWPYENRKRQSWEKGEKKRASSEGEKEGVVLPKKEGVGHAQSKGVTKLQGNFSPEKKEGGWEKSLFLHRNKEKRRRTIPHMPRG